MHSGVWRSGRVPVEHRFLGLDRRTIPYAAVAVAVWLLWTVVLPWIDGRVAWHDPIRAGERIRLTDDVTFAPAVGWGLRSGLRTTDVTSSGQTSTDVVLTSDGVTFAVQRGAWNGTPRQLLDQITRISTTTSGRQSFELSGRPVTFQTGSGHDGVLESFRSTRVEGLLAALVFDGEGLRVQAAGPSQQLATHAEEIGRMISSIREER